MPVDPTVLRALADALAAAPDDTVLRGRYAALLNDAGRPDEALIEAVAVLAHRPDDRQALEAAAAAARLLGDIDREAAYRRLLGTITPPPAAPGGRDVGFNWIEAERELGGLEVPASNAATDPATPVDDLIEAPRVRLADVGGLRDVKKRLEAAFLGPLRNPELRRMYGKSLGGGMLLYGPPGCGKTFLARAIAGELGAGFISIALTDVLDMWFGNSERRLHECFEVARRNAPAVVFIDEVDTLGQRRTHLANSPLRGVVNQLLTELDGIDAADDGVFVLAASNAPWDVDPALKRPGRLDRTMLVLPPDADARLEILRTHLRDRPVGSVDLGKVVKRTEGFSGADLRYVCEAAAESALAASVASGTPRPLDHGDFEVALRSTRATTGEWFGTARNVVLFANEGGQYDELLTYMRRVKLA